MATPIHTSLPLLTLPDPRPLTPDEIAAQRESWARSSLDSIEGPGQHDAITGPCKCGAWHVPADGIVLFTAEGGR